MYLCYRYAVCHHYKWSWPTIAAGILLPCGDIFSWPPQHKQQFNIVVWYFYPTILWSLYFTIMLFCPFENSIFVIDIEEVFPEEGPNVRMINESISFYFFSHGHLNMNIILSRSVWNTNTWLMLVQLGVFLLHHFSISFRSVTQLLLFKVVVWYPAFWKSFT